jgi:RNA polymerase sigma factor (sigma-70 family)
MTRNQLVEENLKFARAVATRRSLGAPRESYSWKEAFSVACEALIKAADTWRPGRGASFPAYAWLLMNREVSDARQKESSTWRVETCARHDRHGDPDDGAAGAAQGRDSLAESDEYRAELVPSPEELLLEAQERARAQDRLSRLPFAQRRTVEDVLAGRAHAPLNLEKIAASVGLKLPSNALPERAPLSPPERSARWYSRLTPEQKEARLQKKRERARKSREARAA